MPKPLAKPTLLDKLWRLPQWLLRWLRQGRVDLQDAHRRRQSVRYRRRIQRAKVFWIGAGLLMALNPELPFVLVVGLIGTLLSFAILDEAD